MAHSAEIRQLAAMVRQGDYRRFLAIQLAPPAQREALYAITACAIELRDVPKKVREPLAGFMRLAWWRDALLALKTGQNPPSHAILQGLSRADPRAWDSLLGLLERVQHQFDVASPPPLDIGSYCDAAWQGHVPPHDKTFRALAYVSRQSRIKPHHILRLLWISLQR